MSGIAFKWEAGWGEGLLAFLFLSLAAYLLLRRKDLPGPVWILRTAALLVLAFLALKPSFFVSRKEKEKPKIAILLDASRTMRQTQAGSSHFEQGRQWLIRNRSKLEDSARLELYVFADRAAKLRWEELPRKEASASPKNLKEALQAAVREEGQDLDGALVLSDGLADSSSGLDSSLSELGFPLDVLGIAEQNGRKGLQLVEISAPDFAFLHLPVTVSVSWQAAGMKGKKARAVLSRAGEKLGEQSIEIAKDFEAGQASFTFVPSSLGRESYRIDLLGAQSLSREFTLDVGRQKLRIMYLSGRPSFEYAHLREFLRSNPNNELVSFVILRDPQDAVQVPDSELSLIPFPAQEIFASDLFHFDLFILQNFPFDRFQLPSFYLANLKRFVEKGGGLLWIGGEEAFARGGYRGSPIEEALPVRLWEDAGDYVYENFSPRLLLPDSPLLQASGAAGVWPRLPALDGYHRFKGVKSDATVLLGSPQGQPLLVISEKGRGRIALWANSSSWKWKLAAGADLSLKGFYQDFWNGVVQYLSGSLDLKRVQFSSKRMKTAVQQPAQAGLKIFDSGYHSLVDPSLNLEVRLYPPKGPPSVLSPSLSASGLYQVDIPALKEGSYRVQASARYQNKLWGRDEMELLVEDENLPAQGINRAFLQKLANMTGGAYSDLNAFSLSDWIQAKRRTQREKKVTLQRVLWASPFWLLLISGIFFLEWALRRKRGML